MNISAGNPVPSTDEIVLRLNDVHVAFRTDEGLVPAVRGASFEVPKGKTLCLVGESGSGKSVTGLSILGLLGKNGGVTQGSIELTLSGGDTVDVSALGNSDPLLRAIRGGQVGFIFQEPMSAMSPVHTIGNQISEVITTHHAVTKAEALKRSEQWLVRCGLSDPASIVGRYSFELSGGQRQRAMIAMALAAEPGLVIADEPTTALDVTIQANVLLLLKELQEDIGMSMLFITHDLGVVAEMADYVAVMYLGKVVEYGTVHEIFADAAHPYTKALLEAIPSPLSRGRRLESIQGSIPHPMRAPSGCPFHPRCGQFIDGICNKEEPEIVHLSRRHFAACHAVETK